MIEENKQKPNGPSQDASKVSTQEARRLTKVILIALYAVN